jgi:DnaJ-class molecular chaperone
VKTLSDKALSAVLGISPDTDAETLRTAYLAKIREYPPEREPEMFERIRDAYLTLSDPKRKMRRCFDAEALWQPMRESIPKSGARKGRACLGTAAWVDIVHHMEEWHRNGKEDCL